MTKIERLKAEFDPLVNSLLQTNDAAEIEKYIKANSNLPGQRGNIELAYALSELLETLSNADQKILFDIFEKWSHMTVEEAPVNTPEELLPFCGVHSIGKLASLNPGMMTRSIQVLRNQSRSSRWRTREAVTMGLQFLLEKQPEQLVSIFNKWIDEGNLLEIRAVITSYCDPKLLKRKVVSQNALKSHRRIFSILIDQQDRRSEEFRVLRKALGYTFSLIATIYSPNSFGVMKKLIALNDKDINWIIKENMKKKRIISHAPERVKEINSLLK